MFDNIFSFSAFTAVLFIIVKLIEMKFFTETEEDEVKPLKFVVRDTALVLVCCIIASFVSWKMDKSMLDFFNVITQAKVDATSAPPVFEGDAQF